MRMPPPPPPTTSATAAASRSEEDAAGGAPGGWGQQQREAGVVSDLPRSAPTTDVGDDNSAGPGDGRDSKALRWGYDPAGAAAGVGVKSCVCGPMEAQPVSTAPSLPVEWLFGAREIANAVRSGSSSNNKKGGGEDTALEAQSSAGLELGKGVTSDGAGGDTLPAAAAAAAGGDAASGVVCTEKDGAGGVQGGAGAGGQTADGGAGAFAGAGTGGSEGEGEANRDFGVASPPPSSGSWFQSGLQSPGGGPAGPMPSAGRPAEGGGGGVAHEGGAGGQDRQKAPSAVDK